MYSPKIREDLVLKLYQLKQVQDGKPMTWIVDELLRPQVLKLHEELVKYKLKNRGVIKNEC